MIEKKDINISNIVMGVLVTISLSMSSFTLKWMFDTNAKIEVACTQLTAVLADSDTDVSQSRQLSKHWTIHSWTRGQINELRVANQMSIESWPNLGYDRY